MTTLRVVLAATLLAFAAACGSSSSPSTAPTPTPTPTPSGGATASVGIPAGAQVLGSSAFAPNPVMVSAGTTVTWSNGDTITHTATADGGQFNSGAIAAGGKFSFTFQTTGTFPYHCTIHPGMVGTVVVQ